MGCGGREYSGAESGSGDVRLGSAVSSQRPGAVVAAQLDIDGRVSLCDYITGKW